MVHRHYWTQITAKIGCDYERWFWRKQILINQRIIWVKTNPELFQHLRDTHGVGFGVINYFTDSQQHIVHSLHCRVPLTGRLCNFFNFRTGLMKAGPASLKYFEVFHGLYGLVSAPFQPSTLHQTDFLCILHIFCVSLSPWFHFFSPSIVLSDFVWVLSCALWSSTSLLRE